MKKGTTPLQSAVTLVVMVAFSFALTGAGGSDVNAPANNLPEARADVIRIDSLKVFGRLERAPVQFLHDKHTDALEKKSKDCSVCHLSQDERLVPKYQRLKDTSKKEVMDIYHTNCVACHNDVVAAGEKSGPVVCGECHRAEATVASSWQAIGMDRSLHYRHAKAADNKCEKCHHEYNPETQKLFYAKGQEGTCRYCHKEDTEVVVRKNIEVTMISMSEASHLACIDCHRKTRAKQANAGPFECTGCHDPKAQRRIEKVKDVPRMQRDQPNVVFVKNRRSTELAGNPAPVRMNRVPFNHVGHEQYNDTCRVCHHASLNACVQCHTEQGAKEGDFVNLSRAMHQLNVNMSCIGCHDLKQREPQCAGCHAFMEKGRQQQDPASCEGCHMTPPQEGGALTETMELVLAASALEAREAVTNTYDEKAIPENAVIKGLSDQYQPATMPHRKIVQTLVNNITDDKLAKYFHADKGTICQGCHHNAPPTQKPVGCNSCHGKPFDSQKPFMPGLMGAYHQQCMGCHDQMGIQKPAAVDCTGCHKPK